MKVFRSILVAALLLTVARSPAQTPAWSGIIDPSRAMDWSRAGIPGGIPNWTTLCSASGVTQNPIQPSNDLTGALDKAHIESALYACSGTSTVVALAAGTFTISGGLLFNADSSGYTQPLRNVVLRGAGPDKTILNFIPPTNGCNGGWSTICFIGTRGYSSSYVSGTALGGSGEWTGDNGVAGTYAKGDSVINVANWVGKVPSVGDLVLLDQRNDSLGICPGANVTTAAWSSGTATLTVDTKAMASSFNGLAAQYRTGDAILVSGVTPAGYNGGPFTVTSVTSSGTVSYALPTTPGGNGSGGQVTSGVTPSATNPCYGVMGATESGTTVTITTTIPHGFSALDCIGVGDVGGRSQSLSAYNSSSANNNGTPNPSTCTNQSSGVVFTAWFQVTQVLNQYQFQYNISVSGLAPSGFGTVTKDTGGVYIDDTHGPTLNEWASNGRTCPDANNTRCVPPEITYRSQSEGKRITACNGSTVVGTSCNGAASLTIDPPLEMPNWRTSQKPGIWWTGGRVEMVGIEGITFDMTDNGAGTGGAGINFASSYECWARNVRGIHGNRNHTWITSSARIAIVDNYFFGSSRGSSQSYGVETLTGSDDLIQNNICNHIVACLMNGQDYGGVFAYNYAVDGGNAQANIVSGGAAVNHDYVSMALFEGNNLPNMQSDNIHGTGASNTLFRNRVRAQDTPLKSGGLGAVTVNSFNRSHNVIGGVYGMSSSQTGTYQNTTANYGSATGATYGLGFQANGWNTTKDSIAVSSLFRWGNYDVATAGRSGNPSGIRWCGSTSSPNWSTVCRDSSGTPVTEVPQTSLPFINANPIPANQTLPASFYLSAQPLFWQTAWGTPGWPAIGPDVAATGALDTTCTPNPMQPTLCDGVQQASAPHLTYQIPAQVCYNNTPIDIGSRHQKTVTPINLAWTNSVIQVTVGPTPPQSGSGYSVGTGIATSLVAIAPNFVAGSGATVNITSVSATGGLTGVTINAPGTGYSVGNVLGVAGGTGGLVFVTSQSGGTNGGPITGVAVATHSFVNSDVVTISGATPSGYNGIYQVCAPNSGNTTCAYPTATGFNLYYQPTSLGAWSQGTGTITGPNIRNFNAANCYTAAYTSLPQPPTASMSVSPTSILAGNTSVLSWVTSNAVTVTITPLGTVALSGSQIVSPATTTTYTLTATNANGSTGATAVLTVTAAPPTVLPHVITGVGVIQGGGVVK